MIPVTIHPYEDGDFPAVHLLEMTGGHKAYRSAVFIRQMGIICRNTFLVAALDKQPIGYTVGALVQQTSPDAWVLRIGVREDQRRNGVGTILLNELMEVFRTVGVHAVRLTVSPWNVPALGLYQKAGFAQESYHEDYFGKDEDRIVMKKELEQELGIL
jgi:[ribosomal protein S18]-alanine N-acetyltransferase